MVHAYKHLTQAPSHTGLALGCMKSNLPRSLFCGHRAKGANTDDYCSHKRIHAHVQALALTCMQTLKCGTHTHMSTQMHTQRGNPGRFISGGLQHSGCLSHFIGHRGRTGMGLFKSNPARPPHTLPSTPPHIRGNTRMHRRFLFRGLTDANQSCWRGKQGGIKEGRHRQAGGRRNVRKTKYGFLTTKQRQHD